MSLIKVVPYVLGMTPGVPGAPEPRMYPRSGYFLVGNYFNIHVCVSFRRSVSVPVYEKGANQKMSLIKVVPYVLGVTPGVPGAPEPRMYPRSGYFLV